MLANIISGSSASGSILAHQANLAGSLQELQRGASAISLQSIARRSSLQLQAVQ